MNQAQVERPIIASGIDNRSRMVVALCETADGRWTTTVRRQCGAKAKDPASDCRVDAKQGSSDQMYRYARFRALFGRGAYRRDPL